MSKTIKELIEEHDYWKEKFKDTDIEESSHYRILEALKEAVSLIKVAHDTFWGPNLTGDQRDQWIDWLKKNGFRD